MKVGILLNSSLDNSYDGSLSRSYLIDNVLVGRLGNEAGQSYGLDVIQNFPGIDGTWAKAHFTLEGYALNFATAAYTANRPRRFGSELLSGLSRMLCSLDSKQGHQPDDKPRDDVDGKGIRRSLHGNFRSSSPIFSRRVRGYCSDDYRCSSGSVTALDSTRWESFASA